MAEIESPASSTLFFHFWAEPLEPRESDETYWGCQLDRIKLSAANERLGEPEMVVERLRWQTT